MEENWENMRAHHERVDLRLGQRRVGVVVHVERALVDHGRRLDLRGRRGQVALDGPQPANRAAHHRGQRTSRKLFLALKMRVTPTCTSL